MVPKKLLHLLGVGKKKDKEKGKSMDPLSQGAAPHSTLNILANSSHLDPCSSGASTALSLQKHEPECSSNISMIKEVHGSENVDYKSFNQFDVVQDYSDHHYAKTSPGKTAKDWAKTIQNEWKLLQRDLPESIYVRVYEDRIDLIRAAIVGPAGTPYHDGLFFFDFQFPPQYPRIPPKVHYRSGGLQLNPNLYENGKVCLSLLNTWWGSASEMWSRSKSTMLQVLVSIQGLVLNDKPYFNEPAIFRSEKKNSREQHSLAYNQAAFLLSCKTMLYSLQKPPKHFETIIVRHFHERERVILEAHGAYASGVIVGSSVRDCCIDQLVAIFKAHRLTMSHMVALSAAHTVGLAHCDKFSDRLYGNPADPTLNPKYAAFLKSQCPPGGSSNPTVRMDQATPSEFDNQYYRNLQDGGGLLASDQLLYTDNRTRTDVDTWAASNTAFSQAFTDAMIKLGRVGIKSGSQGDIRTQCDVFN